MDGVKIVEASREDAEEIMAVQRAAYTIEVKLYGDVSIPPLTETIDELRERFSDRVILKAAEDECIVGSVRGERSGDTCLVGRLCVHPEKQRRGIGEALLREIEKHFPDVARFELFTGDKSAGSLRLYERVGYLQFRTEAADFGVQLVFLDKSGPAANQSD